MAAQRLSSSTRRPFPRATPPDSTNAAGVPGERRKDFGKGEGMLCNGLRGLVQDPVQAACAMAACAATSLRDRLTAFGGTVCIREDPANACPDDAGGC
jgi:hypothetical protein